MPSTSARTSVSCLGLLNSPSAGQLALFLRTFPKKTSFLHSVPNVRVSVRVAYQAGPMQSAPTWRKDPRHAIAPMRTQHVPCHGVSRKRESKVALAIDQFSKTAESSMPSSLETGNLPLSMWLKLFGRKTGKLRLNLMWRIFMFAPCINNINHCIIQLMHSTI
jgi:hypothetical protein